MVKSPMKSCNLRTLNPKFQKNWSKNKVAMALPCLAWAPPNLADWQHLAVVFCFWPFAKLFLGWLIWNFGSIIFIYKGNYVPIATWIEENSEHPNVYIGSLGSSYSLWHHFGIDGSFGGQNGGGLGLKGHVAKGLHTYPHGQFLSRKHCWIISVVTIQALFGPVPKILL